MDKHNENHTAEKDKCRYPGVAVNRADHNKVDPELVKERIKVQNDNPRSDEPL